MSQWTHIVAALDIDTYEADANIGQVVEKMLADAPKITGSEGNAEVL